MSKSVLLIVFVAICANIALAIDLAQKAQYDEINDFLSQEIATSPIQIPVAMRLIKYGVDSNSTIARTRLLDLERIDFKQISCYDNYVRTLRMIAHVVGYEFQGHPVRPIDEILDHYTRKHAEKCLGKYAIDFYDEDRNMASINALVSKLYKAEQSVDLDKFTNDALDLLQRDADLKGRIKAECKALKDTTSEIMESIDFDSQVYQEKRLTILADFDMNDKWLAWKLCEKALFLH